MIPPVRHDSGFSLVEVILAMAILGLTTGMVVFTFSMAGPNLKDDAQDLTNNLIVLSRQAVVSGEMRAVGFSSDGYQMFAFDGETWTELGGEDWPKDVAVSLYENRKQSSPPEETEPNWMFEPTAGATPFTLVLSDRDETWQIVSAGDGTVELVEGRP